MKMNNKILKYIGTTILLLVLVCLVTEIVLFIRYQREWKKHTTPLPEETIAILCENFDLKPDHRLCSGKKEVYGPDFYKIIRESFRPYDQYNINSNEAASFDEVDKKIGKFKYECDPILTTGDGFSYFVCRYDLRGDREYIIGMMFSYPDNAAFRMSTPMIDD